MKGKFMDLRGAVALVTGGNGGLGQRICHALAREGVNVAVMYAQSQGPGRGRRPRTDIRLSDQRRRFLSATSPTARSIVKLLGDVTKRFGKLDILINDAAYNKAVPFADLDSLTRRSLGQDHRRQPYRTDAPDQRVAPIMKRRGAAGW